MVSADLEIGEWLSNCIIPILRTDQTIHVPFNAEASSSSATVAALWSANLLAKASLTIRKTVSGLISAITNEKQTVREICFANCLQIVCKNCC